MSKSMTMRSGLVGFVLLIGCTCCSPAASVAGTGAPQAPRKEDPRYLLEVTGVGTAAGQPAQAELKLTPRGTYHMNIEYPTRIKLTGTGGVVPAAQLVVKADALELKEQQLRFPLKYTASAAGTLDAVVSFSVCIATQCEMVTETIAFPVTVP